MQKRKEYKMTLTQAQAEKMQQLINMTSFAKNVKFEEVEEVKEIDEREEAIKYFESWREIDEGCYGCSSDMDTAKANRIALKHIQGYKNTMRWINEERIEALKNGNYYLANNFETFEKAMKEEFDISEVK